MTLLRHLLAKDLRRVWRNPLPWVIYLIIPLCITAMLGLTLGGKSESNTLGRISFAVVDEDDSLLTALLRGAMNQGQGSEHLAPVFLDRTEAERQITSGKISAAFIIPAHFTHDYLLGEKPVRLELIKNPAQSIHPAVLEELAAVVVSGLNAVARNLQSEFPEWRALLEGKGDFHQVSELIERSGSKLEAVSRFINPPLVGYAKSSVTTGDAKGRPVFNLFAYLLAGMSGMFLLFQASNGMNDLQRELHIGTFARYQTLHYETLAFLTGKMVFTIVLLLLCGSIMLGGGGWIFRIHWRHPLEMAVMLLAYAAFAAGLMAVLTLLMPDERRGALLTTLAAMGLGLAGGCAFPADNLPALMRNWITPNLPSFWFADTLRRLQSGGTDAPWLWCAAKLLIVAGLLTLVATYLARRRFQQGGRA